MAIELYDSLSQSVTPLDLQHDPFRLYACGITPYDTTHLGHAFTYTSVDILVRYLEWRGSPVRYVQNVTDVDDDLLREASERRVEWRRLGDRWTARFIEDMTALNVRAPDLLPRASSVMPQMIEQIEQLLAVGVAYQAGSGVYFSIVDWPRYGSLSRLDRSQMLPIANQRGNHPDDPHKRDPLDFVLWQPQAPGEPAWESPWGMGRPGWHIECSTMAGSFLGTTLDLHVGGADLIFPHHESEIAESEAVTQQQFSKHWMHVAMLEYQGEKMSKSLGNLVLVRDLLERSSPDALRLHLARHHYREPWEHEPDQLDQAGQQIAQLRRALDQPGGDGQTLELGEATASFRRALENDLNTPAAIDQLLEIAATIEQSAREGGQVSVAQQQLRELSGVLGLRLGSEGPEPSVLEGWRRRLSEFNSG